MSRLLVKLSGGIAFMRVWVVLFAFVPCENYNYIYPSIDTKFAPGFSEHGFSQITTGMQASVVMQILGAPLYQGPNNDDTETWAYTRDGKCSWGDFAWLGREITFRDGQVILVVKRVYYD
jgi:outer membrane protein assembly factor BamE (lipoprotein component of BamABCDE complex)